MSTNLETVADQFQAAGIDSVFGEKAKAICDLGYDDGCKVGRILHERRVRAAVEAFETAPAIKAYLRASVEQRGVRAPERHDLSGMAKAAQTTRNQWGKARPAYKADPNCPLRMKLSEAVAFSHSQEAYADYSRYLIPVTGASPADLTACRRNLSEFFRYSDTHTGWAGSGCNWEASLESNEHGLFVVLTCRASIGD